MNDDKQPAWANSVLITAVISGVTLIILFIQRYAQSLVQTTPPQPVDPPQNALPPVVVPAVQPELVLSDHIYNPDYDYQIASPPWGRYTKIIVAIIVLLAIVFFAQRFGSLIAQLVIAAIVAYILNPVINFIDRRTKSSRGTVLIITYLLLAVVVIFAFISLGIAAVQQAGTLFEEIPGFLNSLQEDVEAFTTRTKPIEITPSISITPYLLPWDTMLEQLTSMVQPVFSSGGQLVAQTLTGTISVIGNTLFIFILSIYIAIEIPKLGSYIGDFAQAPGYRQDAERLIQKFGEVWSAYLRGQVILGTTIGIIVWLGLALLGVQNSLALGVLSGLLEFIPIIGPIVGAGAAMLVAFFQPDVCQGVIQIFNQGDSCGVAPWQFMLIVLLLMFIVQQLENNILVPRIVGDALDLHPLLVMLAVFMGSSLAGILGAILAAPVAATLKLIGIYTWRKMFDDYPFEEEIEEPAAELLLSPPSASPPMLASVRSWLTNLRRTQIMKDEG